MQTFAKYILPIFIFIILKGVVGDTFLQIGTSAAFIYYLFLENKNKTKLYQIAISIAILPLIVVLIMLGFINDTVSNIIIIPAVATIIFYFQRFWAKPNKWDILEILKLAAILQLSIAYSINALDYGQQSIVILSFIFLTTRLSQNENTSNMNRNIITGLLILVSVFFIVLSQIKASEAEKWSFLATEKYDNFQEKKLLHNRKILEFELRLDSIQKQLTKCQDSD